MCETCASLTVRGQRAGYRFFLGCGAGLGLWILILVALNLWLSPAVREAYKVPAVGLDAAVSILLPLIVAWLIRKRMGTRHR